MTGLAETLWQEFAVETDEHLLGLEPLLVRLGSAETEPDDVARLFRAVHSLKGLARAMALYGMEAVAHRAENLLGLVRDGGVAITESMLDGLLEAVDTLRGLRETAVAERQDAPAPAPLLPRLAALF
jgi:two-component system, chemotaxis family, sensor kinase CheA